MSRGTLPSKFCREGGRKKLRSVAGRFWFPLTLYSFRRDRLMRPTWSKHSLCSPNQSYSYVLKSFREGEEKGKRSATCLCASNVFSVQLSLAFQLFKTHFQCTLTFFHGSPRTSRCPKRCRTSLHPCCAGCSGNPSSGEWARGTGAVMLGWARHPCCAGRSDG